MTNKPSAHHFDADAMAATLEEPTLTIGNLLYRGRLLSIEEWLPFYERFDALAVARKKAESEGQAPDIRPLLALYRDYLRATFPRSRYRFWAPDPVPVLMREPFTVLTAAIDRFFTLQASATIARSPTPKPSSQTSGTNSQRLTMVVGTGSV